MPAPKTHNEYEYNLSIANPMLRLISVYIKSTEKVECECLNCGNMFKQRASNLLSNRGCPACANKRPRNTHDDYILKLAELHSNIIPLTTYIKANTKILHGCNSCGYEWKIKPSHVLGGSGCPSCRDIKQTKTHNEYINNLIQITNTITPLDKYSGAKTPITHECMDCNHIWLVQPSNVLSGKGCPNCNNPSRFSKIAIHWLESFNNPNIQHAGNIGEHRIPNTRMKVDGYDPTTNTVYEFLGDVWHGNLDVFEEHEQCHPFSDKTAKELNDEWIERKATLEKMGYNVVFIWEDEYKENFYAKCCS